MEPPCRICTHLTSPAAFNPRTLESRYKSPVTRRREYYEPRRCNAKVGTDLKYEFNSRFYTGDRAVNKFQELKRNVQDHDDRPKYHDATNKSQHESPPESSPLAKINDLKDVQHAIITCLREVERIKIFLEDENSWWKILKGRSVDCCQQKMPHLHGVLDGASVTLMLLEEGTDEAPRRFVTSTSKDKIVDDSRVGTSSKEFTSKSKGTEQYVNRQQEYPDEYANSYTIPYYSLDMKSALIEVTSTSNREPTQRYVKRAVRSEQSIAASEFWKEVQEDESNEYQRAKTPERSHKFKETRDNIHYEDKEKIDRSNIVPPKEIRYGQNTQTTFESSSRPEDAFSNENTGSKKHTSDFESNVDLNTEIPYRNVSNHKPRTKTIIERSVRCIQNKFPSKIPRHQNRD